MIPDDPTIEANARLVNEELIDVALALVGAVRDEGPAGVRAILATVPDGRHDALAVVLAAMVDPDRTPHELIGWVDVPLGITSRDRTPVEGRQERRTRERLARQAVA